MPPAEFYERMKNGELPQSQANNPAVIEERFRALLDNGQDIIHIAFSSALSGSYNNVCMVAQELSEEYPDARITVIDTLNVSLGESILVIHANALERVRKNTGFSTIIINDISPSIGTHAGPGALGLLYYGQPKAAAK